MQTPAATETSNQQGVPAVDGAVSPHASVCTIYQQAVELVGRRWTGAIITVLMGSPRRFCEIGTAVPDLSDRLLSQRLRELEQCGIVEHVPCAERASTVRYGLTPMGRDLAPALDALGEWANRWLVDRAH